MAGIKREHLNQKYNKINQQKKFHLLTLFHQRNYSLKKVYLASFRRQHKLESTTLLPKPSFSSTKKITSLINSILKMPRQTFLQSKQHHTKNIQDKKKQAKILKKSSQLLK